MPSFEGGAPTPNSSTSPRPYLDRHTRAHPDRPDPVEGSAHQIARGHATDERHLPTWLILGVVSARSSKRFVVTVTVACAVVAMSGCSRNYDDLFAGPATTDLGKLDADVAFDARSRPDAGDDAVSTDAPGNGEGGACNVTCVGAGCPAATQACPGCSCTLTLTQRGACTVGCSGGGQCNVEVVCTHDCDVTCTANTSCSVELDEATLHCSPPSRCYVAFRTGAGGLDCAGKVNCPSSGGFDEAYACPDVTACK